MKKVKLNIDRGDGFPSLEKAIDFYEMCKRNGIRVFGGHGRDYFISSVFHEGFLWLCIGGDKSAFARKSINELSTHGSHEVSMSDFKEISHDYVKDLIKKPRTKEVYEKAQKQECINDVMMNGSKDYFYKVDGKFYPITKNSSLNVTFRAYRKVEKPIEWWEDVADYLSKYDSVTIAKENGGYVSLNIAGNKLSMTRDQWCDFSRIILEQESE